MPKSSMATRMPRSASARRARAGSSAELISALSVISSWSRSGGSPVRSRIAVTSRTRLASRTCRTARLTLMNGVRPPRSSHCRACLHACARARRPSRTISPVSSATSMKWLGGSTPRSGCSQRTSASTPSSSPSASDTSGWYSRKNSRRSSAAGIAAASAYWASSRSLRSASNSAHLPLPDFFAQCRVRSAARIRSLGVVPSTGRSTMPMLADTVISCPSMWCGSLSAPSVASATFSTSSVQVVSSTRTTNSSPPIRATRWSVTAWPSRCATAVSSWSPMWWPRVSLTTLNPSRSMKQTPSRLPAAASVNARVSRSVNSARLGRPVSGSWLAWCRNRDSLSRSRRSALSRAIIAARRTVSCSSSVRSRSARANPVATVPSSRASRSRRSSEPASPATPRSRSSRASITSTVRPSASAEVTCAPTRSVPICSPICGLNGSACSASQSRWVSPSRNDSTSAWAIGR